MAKEKDSIYEEEYLQHSKLGERRTFSVGDISGRGKEVLFDINWNSLVKKKGYIRISIDGHDAVVSREHLWGVLFMLGSAKEQEQMISPFAKKTQVTKYLRMIGVTASKDIQKGELLNVPLEFTYNPENERLVISKGSMGQMKTVLLKS